MDDARKIAELLCNEHDARLIAGQEDADLFEDSSPTVQAYWLALANAVLLEMK